MLTLFPNQVGSMKSYCSWQISCCPKQRAFSNSIMAWLYWLETETDKMGTEPNESLYRYLSQCSVNISTQFFPSYCLIGICFSLGVSQCKQITRDSMHQPEREYLSPFYITRAFNQTHCVENHSFHNINTDWKRNCMKYFCFEKSQV